MMPTMRVMMRPVSNRFAVVGKNPTPYRVASGSIPRLSRKALVRAPNEMGIGIGHGPNLETAAWTVTR